MCGIAGIYDNQRHPSSDELAKMVDMIKHRGPDGFGVFAKGPVAMGMRRLSIIGVNSGSQPMSNKNNSITIVFNGEIYNYKELKIKLTNLGYIFFTNSDTEVLIHLYDEYGSEMLQYLNGMFVFSIWDAKKNKLFIARDRLGIKPLYYTNVGQRLIYASELKSLITTPNIDISIDLNCIADYLRIGYIPKQHTPYKNIKKLLPGHFISINDGKHKNIKYWDLKELYNRNSNENNYEKDILDKSITNTFKKSISFRMRSDVPVASFLSGGLDSSLISAEASKISKLNTYNVSFANSDFSESEYANEVSNHISSNHKEIIIDDKEVMDKLPFLVWHMDEPISDSAMIPCYNVSKLASKDVKVCLSGLGGDELFGGYSRYVEKPYGPYKKILKKHSFLSKIFFLPVLKLINPSKASKLRSFLSKEDKWKLYLDEIQLFDSFDLKKIGLDEKGYAKKIIMELWHDLPNENILNKKQYIDQNTYLPDQLLALTDRMSMAASLEVRVPFLDHNLVALAAQLPKHQKQTSEKDFKLWLKKKMGYLVPNSILNREKWGFSSPINNWIFNSDIQKIIKLLPYHLSELLNESEVENIIKDKTSPKYHNVIFRLLILAVWLKVRNMTSPPDVSLKNLFEYKNHA